MARQKARYYAVRAGRELGIYQTWPACQEQITGFPGAVFKGFRTLGEAQDFLGDGEAQPKRSAEEDGEQLPDVGVDSGRVVIYTDGACSGNPGPGGYGVVIKCRGDRRELSAGFAQTTNNRMELRACLAALEALTRRCDVTLYTDSRYVADAMTKGWVFGWRNKGWRRKEGPLANADLWKRLLDLCARHDVTFEWVLGHAGNRENERCDELAVEAASGKSLPVDEGFEPNGVTLRPAKPGPLDDLQTEIIFE